MQYMFVVGDKVFHPVYGAGTVVEIAQKEILDETKEFYNIEMIGLDKKIYVSFEEADRVGVRKALNETEVNDLMIFLSKPIQNDTTSNPFDYYDRNKLFLDPYQIAECYKIMWKKNKKSTLSAEDFRAYNLMSNLLITEVAISKDLSLDASKKCIVEFVSKIDNETALESQNDKKSSDGDKLDSDDSVYKEVTDKITNDTIAKNKSKKIINDITNKEKMRYDMIKKDAIIHYFGGQTEYQVLCYLRKKYGISAEKGLSIVNSIKQLKVPRANNYATNNMTMYSYSKTKQNLNNADLTKKRITPRKVVFYILLMFCALNVISSINTKEYDNAFIWFIFWGAPAFLVHPSIRSFIVNKMGIDDSRMLEFCYIFGFTLTLLMIIALMIA